LTDSHDYWPDIYIYLARPAEMIAIGYAIIDYDTPADDITLPLADYCFSMPLRHYAMHYAALLYWLRLLIFSLLAVYWPLITD
jgi:hypothetical protein